MLVVAGEFRAVAEERVEPRAGQSFEPFTKRTVKLLVGNGGTFVEEVVLSSRELEADFVAPAAGALVAFECSVTTRVHNGRAYKTLKAWRLLPTEVAEFLLTPAGA